MARVSFRQFSGIAPQIPPRSLREGMAQLAVNCDLSVPVELKPLRQDKYVQDLPSSGGTVKSLYLYDREHWFTFFEDTDVVRGPLPEDDTLRTYITDSQYPKVTRNDVAAGSGTMPAATYRLGVPRPTVAPVVTVTGEGDPEQDDYQTAYVQTFVTEWGEEGPPSDASDLRMITPGQTVTVELAAPPSGDYLWKSTRLYRLNSGSSSASYQFVTELTFPVSEFEDDVPSDSLAELIPSATWFPPPDDSHPTGPLRGLVSMASGSLAGFTGSTVCVSVPYLPHAYPYEARYTLTDNIVGLASLPAGLLVLTDKIPYLGVGSSPGSMSFSPLPDNQACVSKRSIVNMGGYAIYASPEGLVACDGAEVTVVTEIMFDEEGWREQFRPESIHGYYWEGRYVGFYDNGTEQGGFIYNPQGETAAFSLIDLHASAGFFDPVTDQLYLNVDGELVIFSHPDEDYREATWRSRIETATVPTSYAVMQLVGSGLATVKVYADGALVRTVDHTNVSSGYSFHRLPSGFRAKEWFIEVELTGPLNQADLANSVMELRD